MFCVIDSNDLFHFKVFAYIFFTTHFNLIEIIFACNWSFNIFLNNSFIHFLDNLVSNTLENEVVLFNIFSIYFLINWMIHLDYNLIWFHHFNDDNTTNQKFPDHFVVVVHLIANFNFSDTSFLAKNNDDYKYLDDVKLLIFVIHSLNYSFIKYIYF